MSDSQSTGGPGVPAILAPDPEGGWNVIDRRDGEPLAWRGEACGAWEVAQHLAATYPSSVILPAHDTLVHEIRMTRIGGEPERPLATLEPRELMVMIPDGLGGVFDNGLWRPRYEEGEE